MYRFGITMRITHASGYDEPRDALANDWPKYMQSAFPDSQYLFIPNIEKNVVGFIKKWKINILILSGGDDLGTDPQRDNTETILLEYALANDIPIIGICRGMQLIHDYYGGKIGAGDKFFVAQHRAHPHKVEISHAIFEVNSYHANMILEETIHNDFDIYARCSSDQSVEGMRSKNILSMMWHPERDRAVNEWNKKLIEDFLNKHDY